MFFPFRDNNPVRHTPVVTYCLVAVNVLAFLWLQFQPEQQRQRIVYHLGFVPARVDQLVQPQVLQIQLPGQLVQTPWGIMERPGGQVDLQPSRLRVIASMFTCMFLHGGWLHVIGNMYY